MYILNILNKFKFIYPITVPYPRNPRTKNLPRRPTVNGGRTVFLHKVFRKVTDNCMKFQIKNCKGLTCGRCRKEAREEELKLHKNTPWIQGSSNPWILLLCRVYSALRLYIPPLPWLQMEGLHCNSISASPSLSLSLSVDLQTLGNVFNHTSDVELEMISRGGCNVPIFP